MTRADQWWLGIGSTPREAVREVVPSPQADHVAWVEGIQTVPEEIESSADEYPRRYDVTIIFEDRPAKQWRIGIKRSGRNWRAYFIGGKQI